MLATATLIVVSFWAAAIRRSYLSCETEVVRVERQTFLAFLFRLGFNSAPNSFSIRAQRR